MCINMAFEQLKCLFFIIYNV